VQLHLTGLLPDAGPDHDGPAALQVLIATGPDVERVGERNGRADIIRLRLGAGHVLIHQMDLAPHPAHHQGIADSGTHEAVAHDPDCYENRLCPGISVPHEAIRQAHYG
jgi:hypothetical protein